MVQSVDRIADILLQRYSPQTIEKVVTTKTTTKYEQFKRQYRNDWTALVHDCIKWTNKESGPTFYQDEILANIPIKKRVSVRGPHGLGKTAMASWVILSFALTRDGEDWKCPATASAWRQLTKYLFPELHKWARKLDWDKIGRPPFSKFELLTLNLKLSTGEAFAVASDNAATIEGAHANELLYLFDESKAIPDNTFDAAEGAFSGAGADSTINGYAFAISTPGAPMGRFYDIQQRKAGYHDWWVKHVTLEDAIKAKRISREWAKNREKQWGIKSALYQNRVLGEFAVEDTDTIIPLTWVEKANQRWDEWNENGRPGKLTTVGLDIGGGGEFGDKTVFALCYDGNKVDTLKKIDRGDTETATMQTTGITKSLIENTEAVLIPDVIGIGLGVYHRLNEIRQEMEAKKKKVSWDVYAFNAAESTDEKDISEQFEFFNKRSAAWWLMREMLEPDNNFEIALPYDDALTGELTAPTYKVMSNGKIRVEAKDEIKKRLHGRSTDSADAVIQALTGIRLCGPKKKKWKFYKFIG